MQLKSHHKIRLFLISTACQVLKSWDLEIESPGLLQ